MLGRSKNDIGRDKTAWLHNLFIVEFAFRVVLVYSYIGAYS